MATEKTRIGVLTPNYPETTGGGSTYIHLILSALVGAQDEISFVTITFDEIFVGPAVEPESNGLDINGRLNERIERDGVDILWILAPLGVAVFPKAPFVMTVWDLAHRYYPFLPEIAEGSWNLNQREAYYSSMLPRAALILIGNGRGLQELADNYQIPAERMRAIALPAPPMPFFPKGAERSGKTTLFYPAQFWSHKNHVTAVKALELLRGRWAMDIELVFSGGDQGNEGFVREFVDARGLTDHVRFAGFVSRAEIEVLYREADALLYLSLFGPDNLPPLEAFAAGCPVIASDHPGHREQLGGAALLVDPFDALAVASAIRRLVTTPELRDYLVAAGRLIAKERTPQSYLTGVVLELRRLATLRELWRREAVMDKMSNG